MAGRARRRGIIAEINVTPLVDIMLVLLIIFMLTAQLIANQAIEVHLPHATQGTTPQPSPLTVTLTSGGLLRLNGAAVGPDALRAAVKQAVAKDPKTEVIISADKDVAHGRVVWVIDLVKTNGVTAFAIQIDPLSLIAPAESE